MSPLCPLCAFPLNRGRNGSWFTHAGDRLVAGDFNGDGEDEPFGATRWMHVMKRVP